MIENKGLLERFLRYVKIDTQSAPEQSEQPSTAKQHDLARLLYAELRDMGLDATYDETHCYVYAVLPGEAPALGFVAHMDTSPEVSGKNVRPRVEENYRGGDIVLQPGSETKAPILLSPAQFPGLLRHVGEDLIVTDGATLLGADDKAGVAEIMSMLAHYAEHPALPHRTICVAFTPDEEVGRGTEHFDLAAFGAKKAYTVDGGTLGEIEFECFNAAAAKVTVSGRSVHPGYAKNLMLNALNVAMEFHAMLPAAERPEHTEGYEGFFHLSELEGDVERAVLRYIVRDHDRGTFEARKKLLQTIADRLNEQYRALLGGHDAVRLELRDQYYNMADDMRAHMDLVTRAQEILASLGAEPKAVAIRGGTDGAALTARGVPCPNLCTGGYNFHGRFEYASVQEMETCVRLLIALAAK
ncbi:MAG: peptidase T [Clostridia bacterium]|nr:peptidase T [Clostridia bacterium]